MMFDAIVVGGSIVGASLAYHLAKAGAKTRLIDRRDIGRATDAGAGILSPETSKPKSEDWYRFGVQAVKYYQPLIDSLKSEQASDTGYAVCGLLPVTVSDDEIGPYESAHDIVFERQARNKLPSVNDLSDVSSEQAQRLY